MTFDDISPLGYFFGGRWHARQPDGTYVVSDPRDGDVEVAPGVTLSAAEDDDVDGEA